MNPEQTVKKEKFTVNRKELRREARAAMKATKPRPALVTLCAAALLALLTYLSMRVSGEIDAMKTMLSQLWETGGYDYVMPEGTSGFGTVLAYALEAMALMLTVGLSYYCLQAARGTETGVSALMDGFPVFLRVVITAIFSNLVISCYALPYSFAVMYSVTAEFAIGTVLALPLLVLPVIAFYSYRPAILMIYDYRSMPALLSTRYVSSARALMKGKKWELFKLDLSFIGWFALCIVPFAALWVVPYYKITLSLFYDRAMLTMNPSHPNELEPGKENGGDTPEKPEE